MGIGIAELLIIGGLILVPIVIGLVIVGLALYSSGKFGKRLTQAHCPDCKQTTHIDSAACPGCGCKLR